MREGEYTPNECKNCRMLSFCGGDCRLNSIRIKEKPYSLNGSCKIKLTSVQEHTTYNKMEKYSFNNKTILREESFGAVVSLGVNEFYITTPVYKLLCILKECGTFNHSDLEKVTVVNEVLEQLLSQWINVGIIYINSNANEAM